MWLHTQRYKNTAAPLKKNTVFDCVQQILWIHNWLTTRNIRSIDHWWFCIKPYTLRHGLALHPSYINPSYMPSALPHHCTIPSFPQPESHLIAVIRHKVLPVKLNPETLWELCGFGSENRAIVRCSEPFTKNPLGRGGYNGFLHGDPSST